MAALLSLVIATTNEGKLNELRSLLSDLPIQLLTVTEVLGERIAVGKEGTTFEQNASLKARVI